MVAFLQFLREQLFMTPPYPEKQHSGQTVIVTGANVGLGLEAARHFTRLNAEKVVLAVRSTEKGEIAKKSIEETARRQGVVEVWPMDLSSYESVKQFAKRVEGLKRLDALVENAGIATRIFKTAEDNESTITTNVVSTFLLALLALPKLRETASQVNITPYISIVTSEVHGWVPFTEKDRPDIFQTLSDKATAKMDERYPLSKLLEVFYARELATRSRKSNKPIVVINLVNPGLCHSELSREGSWFMTVLKFFLARTTECGSRTLVQATEAGPESHGQYLSSCHVTPPSPFVRSEEGAKAQVKVWDQLSRKLEIIQPGIMDNV